MAALMVWRRFALVVACWAAVWTGTDAQAQVVRLPESACAEAQTLQDGFESAWWSWPSRGQGGAIGSGKTVFAVPGYASLPQYAQRSYYWLVPDRSGPMPLVVVLHGTAGDIVNAHYQAQVLRDLWTPAATRFGFAVLVPVAGSSRGSWVAPLNATDAPTDYDVIAAAIADFESRHDIERARRYLWGFSAGGHVALDVVVNALHSGFGRRQFAAVAINAGVLGGLACNGISETACNAALRTAFPRLPVSMLVGDADPLRPYAENDAARMVANGWVEARNFRYLEFPGGHWVDVAHPESHWAWMCGFARQLDPLERFRLRPTVP